MQIFTQMKFPIARFFRFSFLLLPFFALMMGGCATNDYGGALGQSEQATNTFLARLNVGDTVNVICSGLPEGDFPPQEKPIKDDGTITLQDIGSVQAAGKTPGELEDAIHNLYVPAHYTHLNVTVKITGDNRLYFVRGEVKTPGRLMYVGPVTVTKAITSAGDFTDYANQRKVFLIRGTKRYRLDCVKILDGEAPDPPVYPNDQIEVKRKLL